MTKYVFVTGGVVSGLGKGIVAASLGRLLKCRGYKVKAQKLDPYLNVDPGTMNPIQHGEVFVTEDGAETDLDLGHYERFMDENLSKASNLTSGRVYERVLARERAGEYLGQTVQIIPHVTGEIKRFIEAGGKGADVLITEIGGTTGDIESLPFIEAARQFAAEKGKRNCCFIHVVLVPYISGSDEYKSKPAQHSVKELQGLGVFPDVVVMRADTDPGEGLAKKLAMFCSLDPSRVVLSETVDCLYKAPLALHARGLDTAVCKTLGLKSEPDLSGWINTVEKIDARRGKVTIALVGKYTDLHDSYLSVVESLHHASYAVGKDVEIKWVNSDACAEDVDKALEDADGILVPGGFGTRGVEGMIEAARYARVNNVPYLGICLGMQVCVIEFARNVAGIKDATSGEMGDGSKVIDLMPDKKGKRLGGTLRLGAYPCAVMDGTQLHAVYGKSLISERHRHRYEFNNDYREVLQNAGLTLCGVAPDDTIVEAVEVGGNRYHLGVQFHPEFKSRPDRPAPVFVGLLQAAAERQGVTSGK